MKTLSKAPTQTQKAYIFITHSPCTAAIAPISVKERIWDWEKPTRGRPIHASNPHHDHAARVSTKKPQPSTLKNFSSWKTTEKSVTNKSES
jgi:hypothetical protein